MLFSRSRGDARKRVAVVVLGDIGRSPRMQYHALSLAEHGYIVDLVGYAGSEPLLAVTRSTNIRIHNIPTPPKLAVDRFRILFLIQAAVRVALQALLLLYVLMRLPRQEYLLVQNPPSFPTLFVAQVVVLLTGARLIIDWHNFGYSILALALGGESGGPIVKFARWYERALGRNAFGHLCVTKAMKDFLREDWGIQGDVVVMYDKAPAHFRRLTVDEIHDFLHTLPFAETSPTSTILTSKPIGKTSASYLPNRPALIVSSTSWTEDEDFQILLDALALYNEQVEKQQKQKQAGNKAALLPNLFVVITGKGPLREYYEAKIAQLGMEHVTIVTAWLAIEDYPRLLGSADLGISLHTSSSGLDLPMKVVDMFGCGLPVCAVGFTCIDELVKHGQNGYVFASERELSQQLQGLFARWPKTAQLDALREGVKEFQKVRWETNWNTHAHRLFED